MTQPVSGDAVREALIGPGDPEENAASLGRFGWLVAHIRDLEANTEAKAALSSEDPESYFEAMREIEELIRDTKPILAALSTPSEGRQHRFGSPPEPVVNPSAEWLDAYAGWYYQGSR